jgi:hypothetical protein
MSGKQIAAHLGISKTGVQAILRNWMQFDTVGRPRISSGEQDEAVINVVRDSHVMLVKHLCSKGFPGTS